MEFFHFTAFFSCLSFILATPISKSDIILSTASTDIETASKQLGVLSSFAINTTKKALQNQSSTSLGGCTLSNLAVRKEWGALSATERVEYTDAVICLKSKPAKTPSELVPGAKNRYDDFVASHINQTLTVHNTGIFLAWHRYFIYEYEQALRTECGYTGYQPYWNWGITARDGVENSPIFDGSNTSMSGNGIQVPGEGNVISSGLGLTNTTLPPGNGGGCVTNGPFKDMEVNLGPVLLAVTNGTNVGNITDRFRYNPRCLKRDLSVEINQLYANMSSIASLILESPDIETFQNTMQGTPDTGIFGVHAGAHYVLGGDPGRDIFASPGDPAFFLNHGMIDRVWWMWQQQDRAVRGKAVAGTGTFLNNPPSANITLDTVTDLGFAAGSPLKIEDLMSTIAGPFCYTYE